MHALIIEDQNVFALLVEDELREFGYNSFDIVFNEAAAIKSATERCPDLITADQRLTSGSGVDAIRAICTDRQIPFVFITSYRSEVREHLPDAIVLGKPFWPPTLHEAIKQAISVNQQGLNLSA